MGLLSLLFLALVSCPSSLSIPHQLFLARAKERIVGLPFKLYGMGHHFVSFPVLMHSAFAHWGEWKLGLEGKLFMIQRALDL